MSRWAEQWVRKSVGIFSFFRSSPPQQRSAEQAKERLQVLLALERSASNAPSFLPQLQDDILKVIAKYIQIDNDKVLIEVERGGKTALGRRCRCDMIRATSVFPRRQVVRPLST